MFNCGDMDNAEQSVRFSIRLARKSNDPDYCGEFYSPVLDCLWNQNDTCSRSCRKSSVGTSGVEIDDPSDIELAPPDYVPCRVCCNEPFYKGAVWYRKIVVDKPLDWREALTINKKFMKRYSITEQNLRMKSYPADTLTTKEIDRVLEKWLVEDGFEPDVVIADYLDIMAPDPKFIGTRHAENEKWKSFGKLRHKYNCLVFSPTQADANSYSQDSLNESNFTEDKRKYGHVTGFLTMNQTKKEAELGIMRLGRMFTRQLRATTAQVVVLQNLQRGMVHLGSFFSHKQNEEEIE